MDKILSNPLAIFEIILTIIYMFSALYIIYNMNKINLIHPTMNPVVYIRTLYQEGFFRSRSFAVFIVLGFAVVIFRFIS
jgi:hypothetical protein